MWGGGCTPYPEKNKNAKAEKNLTADHKLLPKHQKTTTDYHFTAAHRDATVNKPNYDVKTNVEIFVINTLQRTYTNSTATNRYTTTSFNFSTYAF